MKNLCIYDTGEGFDNMSLDTLLNNDYGVCNSIWATPLGNIT